MYWTDIIILKSHFKNKNIIKKTYISIYTPNTIKQDYLTLHLLLESNIMNLINYLFILIYKSRDKQFSKRTSFLFNQ